MVKINTVVFLVCLAFLLLFLWCIYQSFVKELARFNQSDGFKKGLLHHYSHNSNDTENLEEDIPLDSSVENEEIKSYLPCHSYGSQQWFHDLKNGQCYEVGQMGPCGESMTFYSHPRKKFWNFGFCDCDDVVEVKSNIFGCERVERALVYYPPTDRCYTVFSQGPCSENDWLILDKSFHPICATNPCRHKQEVVDEFSLEFWVTHEKKCFKTMRRAYCEKYFILKATKNNWKPECQKDTWFKCPQYSSVSIPSLKCRPGNRIHQLGMCHLLE